MTMLIWAGCDSFAIMMSDRRRFEGRITAGEAGPELRQENLVQLDEVDKWRLGQSGHDVFTTSGVLPDDSVLERAALLKGEDADRHLRMALSAMGTVKQALHPEVFHAPNTILHAYAAHGKHVCVRTEWSPSLFQQHVFVSAPDTIQVLVAGSGIPYVQGIAAAEGPGWTKVMSRTDDWQVAHDYLLKVFAAVTAIHIGVGPAVDTWLLEAASQTWRKIEASR